VSKAKEAQDLLRSFAVRKLPLSFAKSEISSKLSRRGAQKIAIDRTDGHSSVAVHFPGASSLLLTLDITSSLAEGEVLAIMPGQATLPAPAGQSAVTPPPAPSTAARFNITAHDLTRRGLDAWQAKVKPQLSGLALHPAQLLPSLPPLLDSSTFALTQHHMLSLRAQSSGQRAPGSIEHAVRHLAIRPATGRYFSNCARLAMHAYWTGSELIDVVTVVDPCQSRSVKFRALICDEVIDAALTFKGNGAGIVLLLEGEEHLTRCSFVHEEVAPTPRRSFDSPPPSQMRLADRYSRFTD
jgi:hypothetical protein